MDKLKPLIAHKFWIAFGIALIVAFIGWWLDTSSISAEIETRVSAIENAANAANVGGGIPNESWTAGLQELNQQQAAKVEQAAELLWDEQHKSMTWPPAVAPMMKGVPYRGKARKPNGEVDATPLNIYRTNYRSELERAIKVVNPYDPLTDKGKVLVNVASITHVPFDKWRTRPPQWKEMWDAQEDIWLVEDIMRSIAELNSDTDADIRSSNIRRINRLELRGGQRTEPGEAVASAMGENYEDEAGASYEEEGDEMFGGSEYEESGGTGRAASVEFDPSEELGDPTPAVSLSENMGEDSESGMNYEEAGDMMYGEGGFGSNQEMKRYVDDDETLPYRTRGFYLSVIMRDDMLPDLLASLTNSKWPVEILRVHRQDLYQDPSGGGPRSPYAGGGGYGGESYEEEGGGYGGGYETGGYETGGFAGGGYGGGLGGGSLTTPSFGASTGGGFGATGGGFGATGGGYGGGFGSTGFGSTGVGTTGGGYGSREGYGAGGATQRPLAAQAAMRDKSLSHVVIVGLMTLYNAPEDEQAPEGELAETDPLAPAAPDASGTDAGDTDAETSGAAPTDGSATDAASDSEATEGAAEDPAATPQDPTDTTGGTAPAAANPVPEEAPTEDQTTRGSGF